MAKLNLPLHKHACSRASTKMKASQLCTHVFVVYKVNHYDISMKLFGEAQSEALFAEDQDDRVLLFLPGKM